MAQVPVGTQVVLRNQMGESSMAEVMRFDVVRRADDPSRVLATLRKIERLNPASAARTRDGKLDMQMGQA